VNQKGLRAPTKLKGSLSTWLAFKKHLLAQYQIYRLLEEEIEDSPSPLPYQ
jgi:hypothetical protein